MLRFLSSGGVALMVLYVATLAAGCSAFIHDVWSRRWPERSGDGIRDPRVADTGSQRKVAMHRLSSVRVGALTLAISLGTVGCASEPPAPISREEKIELTASVEALDRETRMVSLRGAEGRRATVYAGPEVRNFDQIKVGDEVVVSFYAAIGAEVTTPEGATQGVQQEGAVLRAAEGARPAGAVAEMLTTTVEIDSVDTSMNTVSFRRQDGLLRVLAIEDPKAQAFIRQLKRGDLVKVTYMEAVAVSVRPVS